MRNMTSCSDLRCLSRFKTWAGMARFQAGIVWEDGGEQFFGIFQDA